MKILNFGSLNIDHVYQVDHFAVGGETIHPKHFEEFPGGKGLNQSIAMARAGAQVWHAGQIGEDGDWLITLLQSDGVNTNGISRIKGLTGRAIIQVDTQGQNCILLDSGANMKQDRAQMSAVLNGFAAGDLLIMQNEINEISWLIQEGKKRGLQLALNPSPITAELLQLDFSAFRWIILNELEGQALSGKAEAEAAAAALVARYPNLEVILTLGADGVLYRSAQDRYFQSAFPVQAVDTTGAGDTFTGYFLHSVSLGLPVPEALRRASAAAALAASKMGAAVSIPSAKETASFMELHS